MGIGLKVLGECLTTAIKCALLITVSVLARAPRPWRPTSRALAATSRLDREKAPDPLRRRRGDGMDRWRHPRRARATTSQVCRRDLVPVSWRDSLPPQLAPFEAADERTRQTFIVGLVRRAGAEIDRPNLGATPPRPELASGARVLGRSAAAAAARDRSPRPLAATSPPLRRRGPRTISGGRRCRRREWIAAPPRGAT